MGTTLAMAGAYLLAGELSRHEMHETAFAAYEERMRPFVKDIQKLPPGVPWLAHPKSKFGVKVINTIAGILASSAVKKSVSYLPVKRKPPQKTK